ncbi:MAG: glycosyltransferase family 2 protein, partial [Bdellovibrionales bacterium]
MKPLVSIVIPVFNGEEFLEQAIASALDQDYPNLEILVINDGSVDGSARIANKFGAAIRYFEKSNGGVATALNEGLQRMSGDYFSWLSHDDLYSSNKISAQMARLAELGYPEDVICFSNYEI